VNNSVFNIFFKIKFTKLNQISNFSIILVKLKLFVDESFAVNEIPYRYAESISR